MIRKYPSIFLLLAVLGGILLADITRAGGTLFFLVSVCAGLIGLLFANRKKAGLVWLPLGMSLLFFSASHYAISHYDIGSNHVAKVAPEGKHVQIFGTISDWPDLFDDRTELQVSVDSIMAIQTTAVIGDILVRITDTTTYFQRGDRIEFFGRIYPIWGPGVAAGRFDYRRFLNLRGVHGIVYLATPLDIRVDKSSPYSVFSVTDWVRSQILSSFTRNLTGDASAVASGFLIGETRNIPGAIYERFRDSGTLHLLAVSGSNVALVIGFFVFILRPLGVSRTRRALVLLGIIVLFNLLSYGEPSVLRASVMASLVILAGLAERRFDLNNIIALTAAIILLLDPAQLFTIGFQLSFVIAWGLIFIIPILSDRFREYHTTAWYRWLVFPLMISVVAQLCSTGLILLYFGRLPLFSPLANLIVVPLVTIAVVGSLVLLLADLIAPVFGAFVGSILSKLLEAIVSIVKFFGSESIPQFSAGSVSIIAVIAGYVIVVAVAKSIESRSIRRYTVFGVLILTNVFLLTALVRTVTAGSGTVVVCTRVPGGVAVALNRPHAVSADLIITSLVSREYPTDERIVAPFLRNEEISAIDRIIVMGCEYRAVDDLLRLAEEFSVDTVYIPQTLMNSFEDVQRHLFQSETPVIAVFGDRISPGGSDGLFVSSGIVRWRESGHEVSIIRNTTFLDQVNLRSHLVVVGRTLSEELLPTMKKPFPETIVCPEFEQPGIRHEQVQSADVHDLSEQGDFRQTLPIGP